MKAWQLAVLILLLGSVFAAGEVTLDTAKTYSMGNNVDFPSGKVSYVNTDDTETRLVTSDLKTIRFYTNSSAGVWNNLTAYNVIMNENIPQMRYRGDGTWLAARGDTTNNIYFLKTNSSGNYAIDDTVDVGLYPRSLAWAYNDDTLAVGLANGNIAVLQRSTSTNKFSSKQTISTSHSTGVSKVFGTRNRIYSLGVNDTILQVWWLNTTTGVWSLNQTVTGVGTSTDTASALYVSGNEKRIGVGRSNGDIYILGHSDDTYNWGVRKAITGAHSQSVNFIRITSAGWHMLSGAGDANIRLWTIKDNWANPTNYSENGQSGDWDDVNKQFTVGLYANDNGAFITRQLLATNCTPGTLNPNDTSRCTCASGLAWIGGACQQLSCSNTNFTNIAGGYANSTNTSCKCNSGYVWDETALICVRDCSTSATPNSKGTKFEFLSCECNAGYQWDYTLVACVRYQNCNGMANSNGNNANSNACFCNSGYVWNSSWTSTNGGACQRNCSLYNYTFGVGATDPNTCTCNNGYAWSSTSTSCVLNCSGIPYSNGVVKGTGCECKSNYFWDPLIGQCVSKKSSNTVAIACGIAIPLGILALLGIIGILCWLCQPAAAPMMMSMPMMQSMAPVAAAPIVTSRVVSPTQIVTRPAAKPFAPPQANISSTRVVGNPGFQAGVPSANSFVIGGGNSFGTPGVGPSYIGQGMSGATSGIPINRF